MSPGDPALAMPIPAPFDDAVPDYVQALERAADYLPEAQRALLRRAWAVGAAAHAGQMRKSGEPYITHPVAVAQVLAEQGLDVETLVAAILHDTIEDTPLSRGDIAQQFGETVAELVDGVTKLDKLHFADRQEAAAESFRKMLLAMSRDLRVILIKLADRLHNMRTLGAQSAEARRRIAGETLDIYAPIAQRLGMNLIKSELQDLGFRALHPWRHAVIEKRIRSQPVVRREALAQIEAQLAQKLAMEKVEHRLVGRVKTPWSIYTKMRAENRSFTQVMDVFGYRVVVDTVPECYHALGVAHSVFKPLDGRFRDFIAIPKANGYQSLHTVLFGPYGSPIEVQIRTREMDLVAELPVVQVVRALPAGTRVGADFVLGVAGVGQACLAGLLHVPGAVLVGEAGRHARGEYRVRFEGELVMADVGRLQGDGAFDVVQGHVERLLRQRIHQVEVEIVEAGLLRGPHRAFGIAAGMDAAEALQATVVEGLHAEAEPVHPGLAVAGERTMLDRAGIGLQGDFRVRREAQARAGKLQETVDCIRREQRGRAAAEEHGLHGAAPGQRQVEVKVRDQRIDISIELQRAALFMRVEIAVRAFAHAPRQVHVQRKRRRHQHRRPQVRNSSRSFASASARWLMRFFKPGSISAAVRPCAGSRNTGL